MTKPFFSIVIPTYNRCEFLKATIAITLKQTFKDFELIISDNASTDETPQVVKSFKDKRIRYYRNKINIGAELNYQKAFSYASGKYLFTMGDDDFILFEDTLEQIKKIIDKKNYGFIRLNLIERKFIGKGLRKSIITIEKDIVLPKNSSGEKIVHFFNKVAAGHLAGLVIKNSKGIENKVTDCRETAWIQAIFEATQKDGAFFSSKNYMTITWSQGDILTHYQVSKQNRLMFETYTDYVFKVISPKELNAFRLNFYKNFIILQPAIKLYSNSYNLIKFNQRLVELEPRLKRNLLFWLFILMALLLPKSVWKIIRAIQHVGKNKISRAQNLKKIYNTYAFLEKRYFSK